MPRQKDGEKPQVTVMVMLGQTMRMITLPTVPPASRAA